MHYLETKLKQSTSQLRNIINLEIIQRQISHNSINSRTIFFYKKSRSTVNLTMAESSFMQEGKLEEIVVGYDNGALKRDDDVFKICTKTGTKVENRNDRNAKYGYESGTGNKRFRWNIIFNIIIWVVIPLPLWLPFVFYGISIFLLPFLQLVMSLTWLFVTLNAWKTYWKIRMFKNKACSDQERNENEHKHLVVLAVYKEPLHVILETIQSLSNQTIAENTILAVAFESKSPDVHTKIGTIGKNFSHVFENIFYPIHPRGIAGEIPGKCSNTNHALRMAIEILEEGNYDTDNILVTSCDADTKFHPRYLEALTIVFKTTKYCHDAMYQAPLLYNWALDEANVVTRVTGIMRSVLQMGALIPFSINPNGVFSFSGKLLKAGDYIHPGYQMDDITTFVRYMIAKKKRIRIILVPTPVLAGPTSGRVIEEELSEWARQGRRWTIGAAEVFHYYIIKSSKLPVSARLYWGLTYFMFYGILLCCSALYSLTFIFSSIYITSSSHILHMYVLPACGILIFLTNLLMFLIDWKAPKLLVPKPKERISLIRNLYHLIMSPLVMLAYAVLGLYAFHEMLIRGKKICKHGASSKKCLSVA